MSLIGSLEDLALGDILQILSLSRRSGILYLTRKAEEGKIVFIDGQIISAAASTSPNDILSLLKEKGLVDDKHAEELSGRIDAGGGSDAKAVILASNLLGTDIVEDAVQSYMNTVIFGFFGWTEGNFDFEITENLKEVYRPQRESYLAVPLNPQYVAIEGARKSDEKRRGQGLEEEPKDEFISQIREMEEFIIVDQSADSQTFLKESLESRGFRTSVIADLKALYEYLDSIKDSPRYPMIVADLTIPKTSGEGMLGGMELLSWLSARAFKVPVVMLSSINNEEVLKEAHLNGVYAYLKKPKKFSRTSPDIDAFMEILEKVTTLFRQYQEAGFTFKSGIREVKAKTDASGPAPAPADEEDTGYRFVQDITEELTKEFKDEVELLPETTGQRADTSPGLLTLKSMIDELMNPNFSGEVTLLIMRFASELLNRGILFLVAKNKIKGLGQFGLEAFFENPNIVVKKMEIDVDEKSIIGKVLKYKVPLKESPEQTDGNRKFIKQIGGEWPVESYVVPLLTANRVAAIFYGDNVPFKKKIADMTTFEIFMSQASVIMEKAYLERIIRERKDE